MDDPIDSDEIYGPLDESEEAVAAANELAEKNDDPDMQVNDHLSHVMIHLHRSVVFRCLKMSMYN